MCGLFGLYRPDGQLDCESWAPALVNHLKHRGPDSGAWWSDGRYFLGHRRLSIIGLSSGGQPMATSDGELVVVFNGEIYNYLELREELEHRGHCFRSSSDTEILLHGYREWGTDLPSRLTGMFAFALADRCAETLFLARDRFGEKPLFLTRTTHQIAFASELRPLAALPELDRQLNTRALAGYLLLNYVPGTDSMLCGIHRLPPGTWCRFGRDRTEEGRFWQLPQTENQSLESSSLEHVLEQCQHRLDEAVRLNLRSDVPVGIFLSGGMDSTLIAESAMRQGNLNRAYCLDFAESTHSEYDAAKLVADRIGLPLERVQLTVDALDRFLQLVEHADDPLADSSSLAVYTLARQAAQKNKVVLGGDGGDELLGGYLTYAASRLHSRWLSWLPRPFRRCLARLCRFLPTGEGKVSFSYKLLRFLRAAHLDSGQAHFTWNGTWIPEDATRLVRSDVIREAIDQVLPDLSSRHGLLNDCRLLSLQRADLQDYLPNDILTKSDRMTMAHGLEVRAPFLEHNFASWAVQLPTQFKRGPRGQLKYVLRELARRTLGSSIADRPKQGFSIPIHNWWRSPLAQPLRDLLHPAAVARLGVLEPGAVSQALDDHLSGRRSYGFELWGLAVLVAWHEARVQRRPATPSCEDLRRYHFPLRRQQVA